jgi:hypothetical protein
MEPSDYVSDVVQAKIVRSLPKFLPDSGANKFYGASDVVQAKSGAGLGFIYSVDAIST